MPRSETLDGAPGGAQLCMASEWYIDADGHVEGPISIGELSDRAAGGGLAPTDSVSADRVTWVPANTVPGLTFPARPRAPLTQTVVSGSVYSTPADDAVESEDAPVVTVNGYEILDRLGAGACGVVYKARQEKLNRVVALKTVLMPDKAPTDLLNRFQQEAVSLAKLHHPNIVSVFDSGMCVTPSGQAFFAMELLDGEDLDVRLARTGPLDERTAWLIARQTAAALADAAKHGIIHRDVKPANLFLVTPPTGFPLPEGTPMVKVTDFGLALSRAEGDQRQSVAGTLLGTPVYMAPEQFAGGDVDVRADIYGLGCTVYQMLTGAVPFDGRTVWDVMMKKSAPPPRLGPPIAPESADLVAAMLAIEKDQRPQDYADLIGRIDALPCMDGSQCSVRLPAGSGKHSTVGVVPPAEPKPEAKAEPKPEPQPQRAARPWWTYALAAVALVATGVAIAALTGGFNRSGGPDRSERPAAQATYEDGATAQLFNPTAENPLAGWWSQGGWNTEEHDGNVVLVGQGPVTRKFDPPPHFRVALSIDPGEAEAAEVVVASGGSAGGATKWLIRLDQKKGTAAFGSKRVGSGDFEPAGTPIPLQKKRPYVLVAYERAGDRLTAWFEAEELGGTGTAGLTTTELRVDGVGKPIRIERADLTERREVAER